jgi:flagellar motor switch protein FliN
MAKKLRKFKLAGALPRMSRRQVQVTNALLCHLPQTPFESGFKDRLKEMLEPLVHADIDVWFEGVRALAPGELKQVLAEPTCAVVLGMPPRTEKGLLEVDLTLAQQAIDKLLGGNAEDTDGQRPLSEIEDGVFSYVLLRVLQLMQEEVGAEREVTLKLEGVHGTLPALAERFPVEESYLCLSFRLFFDVKVGYARVYLPEALVQDAFPETPPADGPGLSRWLRRLRERVDIVRLLSAPLVAEVGRIGLQITDVEALEVEDIILVEDTEVRIEGAAGGEGGGTLTGRIHCRVGDGHRGVIVGNVLVGEAGRYEVQIEAITPTGEPRPRAHLFRSDPGEIEGESMASENARRLSAPGVVDGEVFGDELRRRAARKALGDAPDGAFVDGGGGGGSERSDRSERSDPRDEERGAEHSDNGDDGDDGDDPSPEAAGLLEDITVAMVVELGRVMVSAADVVQLRPGQVIELSRAPGEPVDLVVDGKRVGKGELVEIDGELGVRILSLVK